MTDLFEIKNNKYERFEKIAFCQQGNYANPECSNLTTRNVAEIDFSAEIDGRMFDFFFTISVMQFNCHAPAL